LSVFSRRSLDRCFLFGLPILDRIASSTAAVTTRLYSNLGVDLAPAATHTPAIAADALAPSPLRSALAGYRGLSVGCCARLCRPSRSSHRRRLRTDRLAFTNTLKVLILHEEVVFSLDNDDPVSISAATLISFSIGDALAGNRLPILKNMASLETASVLLSGQITDCDADGIRLSCYKFGLLLCR
jgi:hypothetical protein